MASVNLVELRALREQARTWLSKAYAENFIDDDELERRLEAIEDATDPAAIRALYADVVPPSQTDLVRTAGSPSTALVNPAQVPASVRITAIFAEHRRNGAWSPALHNQIVTVFASTELDFREAALPPGPIELDVRLVFGELLILVPPKMPVDVEASIIMGEVDVRRTPGSESLDENGPRLVVTGYVVMAEVDIYECLPGETHEEAKRRIKDERKKLESRRKRERKREKKRQKALEAKP